MRINFLIATCLLMTAGMTLANTESQTLSRQQQRSLALTIYNNNFALVREQRAITLPRGLVELEYTGVAKKIEPDSVRAHSINHGDQFLIIEQSYHFDLLNRQSLLDTYIGRKLKYSRELLEDSKYERVFREGILLSTNPEIVEFGDLIEISPEGVISLPYLPEGLNLSPTLVWVLDNQAEGEQIIETSYVTGGIDWRADYSIVITEVDDKFDFESWVTINNTSGAKFENAKISLITGEVNRVPRRLNKRRDRRQLEAMSMAADMSVESKPTFEYHEYQLPFTTQLADNEAKQIRFLEAKGVTYKKHYSLSSQNLNYQQAQLQEKHASVKLSFVNEESNHLGMPLANGRVRVYHRGKNDNLTLVGEDRVAATASGQTVLLSLGEAFDLTTKRKQTAFRRLSDRLVETSYEIVLFNAKDHAVVIDVKERLQGDWRIVDQSQKSEKVDSMTAVFHVKVRGNSSTTLTYTAQSRF